MTVKHGEPTPKVEEKPRPVVSMWCLGRMGKFGNQLFQYAFLRIFARIHGLQIETPRWIGQKIFGFDDPPISNRRPLAVDRWIHIYSTRKELGIGLLFHLARWIHQTWPGPVDWIEFGPEALDRDYPMLSEVDFWGSFLFPTSAYAPYKKEFSNLFHPTPAIRAQVDRLTIELRKRGNTLVGIHWRQGDFWKYSNCNLGFIGPANWYIRWLEEHWPTLDKPVLLICSDEPARALPHFQKFNPVTARDLSESTIRELEAQGIGFCADFFLLSRCDLLAVSNSSFSIVPAMLSETCQKFFRPDPESGELVTFDPWNADIYSDRMDDIHFTSWRRRASYRMKNIRRMGMTHGYGVLLRHFLRRLPNRVTYEIAAIISTGFVKLMILINIPLKRISGKSISPYKILNLEALFEYFTNRLNR